MSISSTTRTAGPFTGSGSADTFPFEFKVFASADLEVVQRDSSTLVETTLVLNSDYTVTLNANQNANPGGSVVLTAGALATGQELFITSHLANLQALDLTNQGGFYPETINEALDKIVIQNQQQQTELDRAVKLSQFDDDAALDTLVADVTRLAESIDGLDAIAADIDNIDDVAGDLSNIDTVAGSIDNVNTVVTNIADVTTVAANEANINTVAGIDSDVTTVAGISTHVTTVAGIDSNVTTVAGISADVSAVAANEADIDTVAGAIDNINLVGDDIANVNSVAGDLTNIDAVAANEADIDAVAANEANINTVAGVNGAVTTVAGIASAVSAVAANEATIDAVDANEGNINTVAGVSGAVTTVSANVAAVSTVADDIANVDTVADWIDEGGSVAAGVTYDDSTTGLGGNVQAAIDSLVASTVQVASYYFQSYQMTGGNDISVGIYSGSTITVERRTLNIPPMIVNIDDMAYTSASAATKDLNTSANWDSATYATAANRAGKDFYLYACAPSSGSAPDFVLSANATYPTGYNADNSRKVGGFHCLGGSVGTISGHDLTGYIKGDILPRSVWDLDHRSSSVNEGFVYGKNNKWVGIYLPSVSGGELVSVYGGTIADGASSEVFHSFKFEQWFGRIGQSCIDQSSFIAAAIGANQSTNISTYTNPGTTGGHTDTAGRRMISDIGCEDMCGVMWQWGYEHGGPYGASSYIDAYDGNDSGVGGQQFNYPNRPRFGGSWANGVNCGARSSVWNLDPLSVYPDSSSRAVAEPRAHR